MDRNCDRKYLFFIILMSLFVIDAWATDYYVSPTGNDKNTGTSLSRPFATLAAAINAAKSPGDNVFIEPGRYIVNDTEIMGEAKPYKHVFDFAHNGIEDQPIRFVGLVDDKGNKPVFDFSNISPEGFRIAAFHVRVSWISISNVEVVNLRNGATGHSQSENFRLENARHCTLDNIVAHDGMGIGFYICKHSSDNLVVNCDAYNNYDTVGGSGTPGDGGNNDGFGCHVASSADTGNMFVGCRSWNNTDDGFDLINCSAPVTIAYCFAAYNGYDSSYKSRGDGNGFKCGGRGMKGRDVKMPEGGFPMHEIYNNVAYRNKANGIYSNHNLCGINFHDNTSVANGAYNYNFVNRKSPAAADNVDVNGYGHIVISNLSHGASEERGCVGWLSADSANCVISGNSFHYANGKWSEDCITGFLSIDYPDMTEPRTPSGHYSNRTLRFLQIADKAYGSDFSGYAAAVAYAKHNHGAKAGESTNVPAIGK